MFDPGPRYHLHITHIARGVLSMNAAEVGLRDAMEPPIETGGSRFSRAFAGDTGIARSS
jgi:hypothetical protein